MPVLSLPLVLPLPGGSIGFPIRIPFPMVRIGSILPSALNGPFKSSLLALFRLAWSNKIQLPLLITVCFMAFDIRLQLEINIFWENNHPRPNNNNGGRNNHLQRVQRELLLRGGNQQEALRLALLQRQGRILQERARELVGQLSEGRHNYPAGRIRDNHGDNLEDDDEDFDSADGEVEDGSIKVKSSESKKSKKRKRSKEEGEEEDEDEEEDSDDDLDDDLSDDENHDEDEGSSSSQNPEFFGDLDDDPYDHDEIGSEDDSDSDSNGGGTPLVVQLEIRQRPWFNELIKNVIQLRPAVCLANVYTSSVRKVSELTMPSRTRVSGAFEMDIKNSQLLNSTATTVPSSSNEKIAYTLHLKPSSSPRRRDRSESHYTRPVIVESF